MGAKVSGSCLKGFLDPSLWGQMSEAESLPGQAVPRLQSQQLRTLTGITMTLFLFPSALTVMTHTLDSPGRYQASNLFSLPSWAFRELLGKGGGGFGGLSALWEARSLALQTFISLLLSQSGQVHGHWPGRVEGK